ncbi:MAG: glycoside hydrolase family 9 protein [Prolixibacteraceae bacterium]|jgi:endoglucanase|nr:glycoside hydrolase family 9 protein [Prolixibacteraceae bacterium]
MNSTKIIIGLLLTFFVIACSNSTNTDLILNEKEYYEKQGVNYIVFTNWYNGSFGDEKMSGIEIIHHEVRTATNGDVRIHNTPEQWDAIPKFIERKVDSINSIIEASLIYEEYNFKYTIRSEAQGDAMLISVNIENPVPDALLGKAGFNLEFLPAEYFEKSYLADGIPGVFPLYPSGPMQINNDGFTEPKALASGATFTLAPESPERRITIESSIGDISLYDGRNKAQNGWYVLRTLIPANKTGKVVEWKITANTIDNWKKKPTIAYSQLGYHPNQPKVAVVEFDKTDKVAQNIQLLKLDENGNSTLVKSSKLIDWGKYLRYKYGKFDFSDVEEEGLYCIELGNQKTATFRIQKDIYNNAWQPSLDVYLPVQMDHMLINEAYRVWHGKSHMDDALQAPLNHEHFDLYAQGPSTDTPYKPGEHIPGLNVGGWYDAGDYDIRTQTQYHVITSMVEAWEDFGIDRDQTLVDQTRRYVDLHHPDGKVDILQQIEHGALALIAQHRSCGHAIPGIIVGNISQYTHLGDGVTMTDNLIYNSRMSELESNGFESGVFDDRWAFTSRSTALNYGSAAGLAASSRALKNHNTSLSNECLQTSINVWNEEHSKEPDIFRVGNTTGGNLLQEELKAAIELLICTNDQQYTKRILEIFNSKDLRFMFVSDLFLKVLPYMDENFKNELQKKVVEMIEEGKTFITENPYGVPITRGGWAGGGTVMRYAISNYKLHKAFPDLVDATATFNGLNFVLGCHPGSNVSFVSGIGTVSKKVGYGMNRADYSFIAGGVVPGVIVMPPDFPENKENWPFLWGENEYVIPMSSMYIYLVHAVNDLLNEE